MNFEGKQTQHRQVSDILNLSTRNLKIDVHQKITNLYLTFLHQSKIKPIVKCT